MRPCRGWFRWAIRPTATYDLAGTDFLLAYYTAAAARFPSYLANSLERPAWTATVICLELICWSVVCCIALIYARPLQASPADPP